jgi:hypothetical protein
VDLSLEELVGRLAASCDYRCAFRRTFDEPVTADGVARALAGYPDPAIR